MNGWLSVIIVAESLLFGSLLSAGEEQFLTAILVSQGLLLGALFVAQIRKKENSLSKPLNRIGIAIAMLTAIGTVPIFRSFSGWQQNASWSAGATEFIKNGADLFPLAGVVIISIAACARLLLREKPL